MFDKIFADYLLSAGKVSDNDLVEIFSNQEQRRVRLGVIAVSEKLMTIDQVEEINQLQAIYDMRFGDIAIQKGYLSDEQVSRLLVLQGNAFLSFMQAVVDKGCMTMAEFNEALDAYQKQNNYTLSNMEALKSCDIDRIIPIYLFEQDDLTKKLCGIMIRTMSRLIDYRLYIKAPVITNTVNFPSICVQELKGERNIVTALSGDIDSALMAAAKGFAGKENVTDSEDCLDALCELINCVNGLLATEMSSQNVDIDMDAPFSSVSAGSLRSESILTMPVIVYGSPINLHIILDQSYTI